MFPRILIFLIYAIWSEQKSLRYAIFVTTNFRCMARRPTTCLHYIVGVIFQNLSLHLVKNQTFFVLFQNKTHTFLRNFLC